MTLKQTISILFCLTIASTVIGQTFKCDGRMILSTVKSNTINYSIEFGPFGAVYYNPISSYLGEQFDGLGFNPKDNYIYATQTTTQSIVRLKKDNTYEVLSTDIKVNSLAGDCSPDGQYLCHDIDNHSILVFDVLDDLQLVNQIDLFWDPALGFDIPFTTLIEDFAIDPTNPSLAYSFQGNYTLNEYEPVDTRGYILEITLSGPEAGKVKPLIKIDKSTVLQLKGLFFLAGGRLYGYGPYTQWPLVLNRFVSIDIPTETATVQGITSPQSDMSDGCSCPYNLSFQKTVFPLVNTCSNDELTYTLSINNRSNEPLNNLKLTDTMPDGMIIKSVSDEFDGSIDFETGVGKQYITINNLNIAPKEFVRIEIVTEIVDITTGPVSSQAHLFNLPLLFDGYKKSDDPATQGYVGDATAFYSSPKLISEVDVQVFPPSNCLNPNDARLILSSPTFLANEPYEIEIRNEGWEFFDYDITVDNENTFVLDSIYAGEYALVKVKPLLSRCSFEWDDTTILIEPPNEQLKVTAMSNSPICAGSALNLDASIQPDGSAFWDGPDGFVSFDQYASIDTAQGYQTGLYELTVTYGECEQYRTLDVLIAPEIEAKIDGKLAYCDRDRLRLEAQGIGDELSYLWKANGFSSRAKSIVRDSFDASYGGEYMVVVDNTICRDTAYAEIDALYSPTIELDKTLKTDFCETIALPASITGDNNVTYSWLPKTGLSCADCLNPILQAPFESSYQLIVQNEIACADTATVMLTLDKEKILFTPNVFSPNGDGQNDFFELFAGCGVNAMKNLRVIDRWGNTIFYKENVDFNNIDEFWDGYLNGSVVASGVYIWQLELELVDGSSQVITGDVTVLKGF